MATISHFVTSAVIAILILVAMCFLPDIFGGHRVTVYDRVFSVSVLLTIIYVIIVLLLY